MPAPLAGSCCLPRCPALSRQASGRPAQATTHAPRPALPIEDGGSRLGLGQLPHLVIAEPCHRNVPYRQWTLCFPHRLRWVLLRQPPLPHEAAHAGKGAPAVGRSTPASPSLPSAEGLTPAFEQNPANSLLIFEHPTLSTYSLYSLHLYNWWWVRSHLRSPPDRGERADESIPITAR